MNYGETPIPISLNEIAINKDGERVLEIRKLKLVIKEVKDAYPPEVWKELGLSDAQVEELGGMKVYSMSVYGVVDKYLHQHHPRMNEDQINAKIAFYYQLEETELMMPFEEGGARAINTVH